MTISPELGLVIMMNNYFHDVATALLISSAAALWVMLRRADVDDGPGGTRVLLRLYASMSRLARFSLAWIILAGIPRVIFFMDFEWANAVGKLQVPALVLKHVVISVLVAAGVWFWVKLRRRVAELRATAGAASQPS